MSPIRMLAAALVTVTSLSAQTVASAAVGSLTGRVTTDSGHTLMAGIAVTVSGSTLTTRTDSQGVFMLRGIPIGVQEIRFMRPGYRVVEVSTIVVGRGTTKVDIAMVRTSSSLDTMKITADNWLHKPARLANTVKYDEFYERRATSAGGKYFTHDELERKVNASLVEMFSGMASVRLQRVGTRYFPMLPGCPYNKMAVYLDNTQIYPPAGESDGATFFGTAPPITPQTLSPLEILAQLDVVQVEGIEFYKSVTGMPTGARGTACAAMYIWLK